MKIKTIFLDRDGVINKERKYLYQIKEFDFFKGVFEACLKFKTNGYEIIIVTNQSGIARGYYTQKDYETLNIWMLNQFKSKNIDILDVFHCPHSPNDKCQCRKPLPGMFLEAQKKYKVNMKESWMIGDKEDDIIAANNSGIENTILVRSGHKIDELASNAKYFTNSICDTPEVIIK